MRILNIQALSLAKAIPNILESCLELRVPAYYETTTVSCHLMYHPHPKHSVNSRMLESRQHLLAFLKHIQQALVPSTLTDSTSGSPTRFINLKKCNRLRSADLSNTDTLH